MTIQSLSHEISRKHFPNPPAPASEIEAFEERMGWRLDADLRAFYLRHDGADLFNRPNAAYRILPLSEVRRARLAILGDDDDAAGPASWYAICANQDLDYMAIDVSSATEGRYPIIDCWREVFPDPEDCKPIARSFSEFLERALQSGGRMYWLTDS